MMKLLLERPPLLLYYLYLYHEHHILDHPMMVSYYAPHVTGSPGLVGRRRNEPFRSSTCCCVITHSARTSTATSSRSLTPAPHAQPFSETSRDGDLSDRNTPQLSCCPSGIGPEGSVAAVTSFSSRTLIASWPCWAWLAFKAQNWRTKRLHHLEAQTDLFVKSTPRFNEKRSVAPLSTPAGRHNDNVDRSAVPRMRLVLGHHGVTTPVEFPTCAFQLGDSIDRSLFKQTVNCKPTRRHLQLAFGLQMESTCRNWHSVRQFQQHRTFASDLGVRLQTPAPETGRTDRSPECSRA